jgi:hypothetical protein
MITYNPKRNVYIYSRVEYLLSYKECVSLSKKIRGNLKLLNKKGMSPLLLTILLIGLAVGLGAVIITWSSDQAYSPKESCEKITLTVQKAFDKDLICFNEATGKLKLVVKNDGQGNINSILYRKINLDLTTRDVILPTSALKPGQIYQAEVPHVQNERVHIEIIPQIKNEEETTETLCINKAIIKEDIPACT